MQPPKCAKIVSKIEKIRVFNRLDFQNQGSRAGGGRQKFVAIIAISAS